MSNWRKKEKLRMKPGHAWKAKEGYKIFVADRGAVRFDFPESWVFMEDADTLEFRDRKPPNDTCGLQVTVMRLHPGIDWSELPIAELLEQSLDGDREGVLSRSEVRRIERSDMELVWAETHFIDPEEKREAISRTSLARREGIMPLMTMSYWPEDEERVVAVWEEVMRSLRLGVYIADPTTGRTLN